MDIPRERIDPSKTAVLVIDVQNDFCSPEGWFGGVGHDLSIIHSAVQNLKGFLGPARDAGNTMIFVRGVYDQKYLSQVMIERHERDGLPLEHCIEGSWGAGYYEIAPETSDIDLVKHRYSAFIGTELDDILKARGIENLILTGITSNVCVESTARDGYMYDYRIVFVSDCTGTYSQSLHDASLENITRSFGVVVTSDDLIEAWGQLEAPSAVR